MFSDKKTSQNLAPTSNQNRINEGTHIIGDITSTGFFRIDGTLEGNITNPSRVVIGKSGIINGNLICDDADIEGKFEGTLQVTGTLTLKATAVVIGNITVGKLSVETGANIEANCSMFTEKKESANLTIDQDNPYSRKNRGKKISTPSSQNLN